MADRFWVSEVIGAVWSDPDSWASASGGLGGAGVPTIDDDVYFDDGGGLLVSDCNIDTPNVVCNAFYAGIASSFPVSIIGSPSTILVKSGTVQTGGAWPGGISNVTFLPLASGLVQIEGVVVSFSIPNALPNISAFAAKPGSGVPGGYVGAVQLGDSFVFEGQVKLPLPSTDNHVQLYVYDSLGVGLPILVAEVDDFNFAIDTWYSLAAIFGSIPEWTPAATGQFYAQLHIDDNTNGTIADAVDGCNVTDFPPPAEVQDSVMFFYGVEKGTLVVPICTPTGGFLPHDGMGNVIVRGTAGVPIPLFGSFTFQVDTPGVFVQVGAQDITNPLAPIPLPDIMPAAPYDFLAGASRSLDDLAGGPVTFTPPYDGDFALGCVVLSPGANPVMWGAEVTTLAAGGPSGGAVQDVSVMDPTSTYQIMRGSPLVDYPVGGQVVFDADTAGVSVEMKAYDITNPAAPVLLGDLIPLGLFDFTAATPRTLADLAGGPLVFTPPDEGDFMLALTVAPPGGASADEVAVFFTTQPIGPTPPPPPPPITDEAVECTRDYPENLSQGFNVFPLNPAMLRKFGVVGDWGLVVNQPTYPKNGFFCNSVSGLPALGQTAEFRAVVAAGEYTFRLWAPKNSDCGMVDIEINGFSVAVDQDLYAAALDAGNVIEIPRVRLAAGLQRIKFTVSGKNPASSNFFFRMIGFDLAPWQPGTV